MVAVHPHGASSSCDFSFSSTSTSSIPASSAISSTADGIAWDAVELDAGERDPVARWLRRALGDGRADGCVGGGPTSLVRAEKARDPRGGRSAGACRSWASASAISCSASRVGGKVGKAAQAEVGILDVASDRGWKARSAVRRHAAPVQGAAVAWRRGRGSAARMRRSWRKVAALPGAGHADRQLGLWPCSTTPS